jgi:hypothetical protein
VISPTLRIAMARADIYRWHAEALALVDRHGSLRAAGIEIDPNSPQCGWYKRRMVRDGPFVAAEIWMEQPVQDGELIGDQQIFCEVDGVPQDPLQEWTFLAARPISEQAFRHLRASARWTRVNAPDEPLANPHQAVDHLKTPIPF